MEVQWLASAVLLNLRPVMRVLPTPISAAAGWYYNTAHLFVFCIYYHIIVLIALRLLLFVFVY